MLVRQILKSKKTDGVVNVRPGTPVLDAAGVLSRERIGTVIVSQDGENAVGILSERDIVRELGRRGIACMSDPVDVLMTENPVSCACDDTADQVLQKMTDGRFRHMPVIDDGKMVGLISIGDVVKARLSELSMEKDALEGMIKGF